MTSGPFQTIPVQLGAALGITSENAALLLSCCVLVSIALALAMIGGRKLDPLVIAVPMMGAMAFLVAIAWLPFWILFVIAILMAVMFAGTLADRLGGR